MKDKFIMNISHDDYIDMLYDLEAGLYQDPCVSYHDIRRLTNKTLQITMRLKKDKSIKNIEHLVDRARVLGWAAVNVQKFFKARVIVNSEIDLPLHEVVIN